MGAESVRRWVIQAEVDAGDRAGPTSQELAEIKSLKARVRQRASPLRCPQPRGQPHMRAAGKPYRFTNPEIIRCLKRALARHTYRALKHDLLTLDGR